MVYNSITEKKFDQMRYRMISLHKKRSNREERPIFGLTDDDFIWQFCRVRYVDDSAVQIEVSRMPSAAFADLDQQVIEHSLQQYVLPKGYYGDCRGDILYLAVEQSPPVSARTLSMRYRGG